jgi:hypothetical protein
MKVEISRILNLDGTWQGYRLSPWTAYGKPTWPNPGQLFSSLNELINFYQLENVRELGTQYTYDNKNQKYGIERYDAVFNS